MNAIPALLASLLLCACASSWPAGSYAKLGNETDTAVVGPAVQDCLGQIEGQPIRTVIAPFEGGEFIRVASPLGICSQYFARATAGTLKPSGPLMVIKQ